jgi:hypothetical protein
MSNRQAHGEGPRGDAPVGPLIDADRDLVRLALGARLRLRIEERKHRPPVCSLDRLGVDEGLDTLLNFK